VRKKSAILVPSFCPLHQVDSLLLLHSSSNSSSPSISTPGSSCVVRDPQPFGRNFQVWEPTTSIHLRRAYFETRFCWSKLKSRGFRFVDTRKGVRECKALFGPCASISIRCTETSVCLPCAELQSSGLGGLQPQSQPAQYIRTYHGGGWRKCRGSIILTC
jgi:hypothetical protein